MPGRHGISASRLALDLSCSVNCFLDLQISDFSVFTIVLDNSLKQISLYRYIHALLVLFLWRALINTIINSKSYPITYKNVCPEEAIQDGYLVSKIIRDQASFILLFPNPSMLPHGSSWMLELQISHLHSSQPESGRYITGHTSL